jgi:hypothetical protein
LTVFCQPLFKITVHAFDHDSNFLAGDDDDLGMTNYTYTTGTTTFNKIITTERGLENLR